MTIPFGKYVLQRKLAEGGMAEIFLAHQSGIEGFERKVVIKRLLPDLSVESDFVRMFLNEARLAARLTHPNIVHIYELGVEEGAYFLAMEYIQGEDLRALAQQADVLTRRPHPGLVCRIIAEVLAGLHYAHTRAAPDGKPLGLVHRDVSPQNILVTYDGAVKIIDFGIAKATQRQQSDQTQVGALKGKYAYMSPEQTRGGQLDARSDVFSAGILLWELLTWRRLFKRATDLATLVAVSDEPAPPMSMLNAEVPHELDAIGLRALSLEPDGRFSSAQEFRAALEELIQDQGWEADTRALSHFMRELFADKLAAEQAEQEQAQQAQKSAPRPLPKARVPEVSARREAPPLTMPLQTIDPQQKAQIMAELRAAEAARGTAGSAAPGAVGSATPGPAGGVARGPAGSAAPGTAGAAAWAAAPLPTLAPISPSHEDATVPSSPVPPQLLQRIAEEDARREAALRAQAGAQVAPLHIQTPPQAVALRRATSAALVQRRVIIAVAAGLALGVLAVVAYFLLVG